MCTICQSLNPELKSYDFHGLAAYGDVGSESTVLSEFSPSQVEEDVTYAPGDSVDVRDGNYNGKPVYNLDQIANQLTDGYWNAQGRSERSFDLGSSKTLDVNLTGLTNSGKYLARNALDAWSEVSGINFREVTGSGADITFDDNQSGAYASSSYWNGTIISSSVNISTAWVNAYGTSLDSYSFQTYIHEIGHALGLGHAGNYNGSGTYSSSAHYANDSWQTTVMSYFSETQNSFTNANFGYLRTPQIADILAIQNLYGAAPNTRAGNTTYGDGQSGGMTINLLGSAANTIYDGGGIDTINLASRNFSQRLDLNAETFSDINGRVGNLAIARNTVIENATTGSRADEVIGNGAANLIRTNGGNDTIFGNGGNDRLDGGAGNDTIDGGGGNDAALFSAALSSFDVLYDYQTFLGNHLRLRSGNGTDTLIDIETLKIAGGTYLVDTIIASLKSEFGYISPNAAPRVADLADHISGPSRDTGNDVDATLSLGQMYTGSHGNAFEGQTSSDGNVNFEFSGSGSDLTVQFNAYDVDRSNEIEVFINGESLGFVARGVDNGLNTNLITIDAADLVSGSNTLTFEQNINNAWKWGVTDILVANPNASNVDVELSYGVELTEKLGNINAQVSDADGSLSFAFAKIGGDVLFEFSAFDVDYNDEIEVFLNGDSIAFLNTGGNLAWRDYDLLIDQSQLVNGENILTFEQARNPNWVWGIEDIMVSSVTNAPWSDPVQLSGGIGQVSLNQEVVDPIVEEFSFL